MAIALEIVVSLMLLGIKYVIFFLCVVIKKTRQPLIDQFVVIILTIINKLNQQQTISIIQVLIPLEWTR